MKNQNSYRHRPDTWLAKAPNDVHLAIDYPGVVSSAAPPLLSLSASDFKRQNVMSWLGVAAIMSLDFS
ncbi:hypothetical protein A6U89_31160 [Agrobacterium sp. B133/95]|nr:hypothetical protein A6U89_31160 [Agrobacterium sp. B133/95]